jgi:putative MFS transporter
MTTAAAISARLDRLPTTRRIWMMVVLLSLGGCFEYYDLFLTGFIAPGQRQASLATTASRASSRPSSSACSWARSSSAS